MPPERRRVNLRGNNRSGLAGIRPLKQSVRFRANRVGFKALKRRIRFVKGRIGAISQAERSPIRTGRNVNVNSQFLRRRLIELGEAFSDICNPEPHDRVFAGLVVGPPTEYLRTDYALAKEVILP
jgi:hypothetical protein